MRSFVRSFVHCFGESALRQPAASPSRRKPSVSVGCWSSRGEGEGDACGRCVVGIGLVDDAGPSVPEQGEETMAGNMPAHSIERLVVVWRAGRAVS